MSASRQGGVLRRPCRNAGSSLANVGATSRARGRRTSDHRVQGRPLRARPPARRDLACSTVAQSRRAPGGARRARSATPTRRAQGRVRPPTRAHPSGPPGRHRSPGWCPHAPSSTRDAAASAQEQHDVTAGRCRRERAAAGAAGESAGAAHDDEVDHRVRGVSDALGRERAAAGQEVDRALLHPGPAQGRHHAARCRSPGQRTPHRAADEVGVADGQAGRTEVDLCRRPVDGVAEPQGGTGRGGAAGRAGDEGDGGSGDTGGEQDEGRTGPACSSGSRVAGAGWTHGGLLTSRSVSDR